MKIETHIPPETEELQKKEKSPEDEARLREFFERHQDFFRSYAGDESIRVEPAPPGLNTFAIDLENGVLYGDPRFFTEKGFSDGKALFAFLHEFEHFRELREMLAEKGGDKVWQAHSKKLKGKRRTQILDNVWDDVRMNRSVVNRAPVMADTKSDLYKENLFAKSDFTDKPKHLQFAYTLLREKMLPDEPCTVAPDVREAIDRLENIKSKNGISLLDYASRPDIPPSLRIKLQEKYLEPIYERFFKEDVENKKKEEKEKGDRGEKGEGQGEEGDQDQTQDQEASEESKDKKGKGKPQKGEKGEPKNPEDYFSDEYDEFDDKNPDHALPDEVVEKAIKDFIDAKKKKGKEKTQEELLEEAYALEAGVTVQDLRVYQKFWQQVDGIKNPETDESVIEELRAIFRKIITERMSLRLRPKQPMTEGEILVRPAEAVALIKAGISEPAVWETLEVKERKQKLFGKFDITVVADRSGSMQQGDGSGAIKYVEQRKAVALILESLTEFSQELEEVRRDLDQDLHVRTEAWSFGDPAQIEILKPLSETLTEKERVAVYKKLQDAPGKSTQDYGALERIKKSISEEDWREIEEKKLRKIVIVLSDGDSSNASETQRIIKEMREKGITVVGVGITTAADSIKTTYVPDGKVCPKAGDLGATLGKLLEGYLKDL